MGTRGVVGFHRNGVDKITYNHFDSYPSDLGERVKDFLMTTSVNEMLAIFDRIIMVNKTQPPTPEQIEACKSFTNLSVNTQRPDNWYNLLREAQGNLNAYKGGLRYMIDNVSFLQDSLFCEWGYVINLDTNVLEIYRGFQKTPQWNRYYTAVATGDSGYFNCQLIKTVPLAEIARFDMSAFERQVDRDEELAWYHQAIQDLFRKHVPDAYTVIAAHQFDLVEPSTFKATVMTNQPTIARSVVTKLQHALTEKFTGRRVTITVHPAENNDNDGWTHLVQVTVTIVKRED